MKKTAIVAALALTATVVSSAAAAGTVHSVNRNSSFITHGMSCGICVMNNDNHCGDFIVPTKDQNYAAWEVRSCADQVKATFPAEQGVSQKWVTCAEAITSKELQEVCEANEIAHATVFRQRNVDKAGDLTALNWQTAKKATTIILFRAEGSEEWTLLAQSEAGVKTAEAALPGAGSYVVAMTW